MSGARRVEAHRDGVAGVMSVSEVAVLWEGRRHEPLEAAPWDEERVRGAIVSIVRDAEERFDRERLWPVHALDEVAGPSPKGLYFGAAGVMWSLDYLARSGAVVPERSFAEHVRGVHERYLAAPDTGEVVPSLFLGEAGILLAAQRLAPSRATADRLHHDVQANVANPTNELLWGAPGTLLAALFMLEWTGEARWRDLATSTAESLVSGWRPSCDGAHLWTQHLYGDVVEYVGAAHGFAGNVHALLRAAPLFPGAWQTELYRRCAETAVRTARTEGAMANWPPIAGGPGRSEWLVQWCHGAPGVIAALAAVPPGFDERLDRLLAAGGELVWRAGPLEKGPGLCHGTAGNGYAFLELLRRIGDPMWLERARAFAMHAVSQWARMRARHGCGRYSLWTGDPGLAVYLWDCIRAEGKLPVLDAF